MARQEMAEDRQGRGLWAGGQRRGRPLGDVEGAGRPTTNGGFGHGVPGKLPLRQKQNMKEGGTECVNRLHLDLFSGRVGKLRELLVPFPPTDGSSFREGRQNYLPSPRVGVGVGNWATEDRLGLIGNKLGRREGAASR